MYALLNCTYRNDTCYAGSAMERSRNFVQLTVRFRLCSKRREPFDVRQMFRRAGMIIKQKPSCYFANAEHNAHLGYPECYCITLHSKQWQKAVADISIPCIRLPLSVASNFMSAVSKRPGLSRRVVFLRGFT